VLCALLEVPSAWNQLLKGHLPWFSPVFLGNRWYDVVKQTSQPRPISGLTDCHTTTLQNQHCESLNCRKAECKPVQCMFHVCINRVSPIASLSILALRGVPIDTCFVGDEAVMLGDKTKETSCTKESTLNLSDSLLPSPSSNINDPHPTVQVVNSLNFNIFSQSRFKTMWGQNVRT